MLHSNGLEKTKLQAKADQKMLIQAREAFLDGPDPVLGVRLFFSFQFNHFGPCILYKTFIGQFFLHTLQKVLLVLQVF